MSTERQFQLNVNIKEEMDDRGTREKMEPFDDMVMTDKFFAVKEEPLPEDAESLSTLASPQPASPSIVVKRETCECTGEDCDDCMEAHQSESLALVDDSDRMPSDWFSGDSSDSEEAIDDASVAVLAASVSNFPIKEEPFSDDTESLSAFASPQPASPSIVVKGETCPCTGPDCPDCFKKRSPPCPECGKTCSRNSDLKMHLRVHTGERPYVCSQCPKAFTQLGALKYHQLTHQAVRRRPFKCTAEGCGKAFATKQQLTLHTRLHTGERPYKCARCDKGFPTNRDLTLHIRKHTGEKPYQCDNCAKAFTTNGELTIHRRSHTGDKPYKCARCGKACTRSSDLTVHLRSHTGERPYRCPLCPKAFATSSNAKKHQRTVHPRSL